MRHYIRGFFGTNEPSLIEHVTNDQDMMQVGPGR
jgi:hypothetical protein